MSCESVESTFSPANDVAVHLMELTQARRLALCDPLKRQQPVCPADGVLHTSLMYAFLSAYTQSLQHKLQSQVEHVIKYTTLLDAHVNAFS